MNISDQIGNFTGPELADFDEGELSKAMVGAFKYEPRFVPNQGTIQGTIGSGKLCILSDPELREAIINWKSDLERIKNQENYVVERRDLAHHYFISSGNFRRHLFLVNDGLIEVEPGRFPKNDFKFLEDQSFESNLYLFIVATANLEKNFYPQIKDRIEVITALIKKDLKTNKRI